MPSTGSRLEIVAVCAGLLALAGLIAYSWLVRPPIPEEAASLAGGRELVAYSDADRRPHLLMIEGDRLVYDRPDLDWDGLSTPAWRLTGEPYRLDRQPTPASAAVAICAGDSPHSCDGAIELVGEIADPAITHVEIAVDGVWERHRVFGRGFILRLDRRRANGDVRWLSVQGSSVTIVWAIDRDLDGRIAAATSGAFSLTALDRPPGP